MDSLGKMRSFFDEQSRRKRRTYFFVILGLVWMVIMGCLTVVAHVSLFRHLHLEVPVESVRWGCLIASIVALCLWGLSGLIFYFRSAKLLPFIVGAHPANDLDAQRLGNVAQEMALAAGVSPNKVRWYILETSAQNAFACGRSVESGSIVVTRGMLEVLNRDELQGVVAHELAHLKNGDTQFITTALAFAWVVAGVTVVATLLVLTAYLILVLLLMGVAKLAEGSKGVPALICLLLGLAGLFVLFQLVIFAFTFALLLGLVAIGVKAASSSISQSREYLADACSAQWTRNPLALASALAKISGHSQAVTTSGNLVSPLWLDSPSTDKTDSFPKRMVAFMLRSHPASERRIHVLREMAGSAAFTEKQWLAAIPASGWQRTKEWLVPTMATIFAVVTTVVIIHDWL